MSKRLAVVKNSAYVPNLPDGAIVIRVNRSGEPELREIITVDLHPTSQFGMQLRQWGEGAFARGEQRELSSARQQGHELDLINSRMVDIGMEIMVYPNEKGENIVGLVDGRTRLAAAIFRDVDVTATLKIRYAKNRDEAIAIIAKFDSKEGARTGRNIASYIFHGAFGQDVPVPLGHVMLLNAAISQIYNGCNGNMSNVAQSNPTFQRGLKVATEPNLMYLRNNYLQLVKDFKRTYPLGREQKKYLNFGIATAVVLTKLVDGDDSASIWQKLITGENLTKGPLLEFRDSLQQGKYPGGEQWQKAMFNRALHAYLAEKKLYNAHMTTYTDGQQWQITKGLVGVAAPMHVRVAKPKVARKLKKVA